MTFQDRSNNFQVDIEKLQKKYDVALYAAQVVLQNGEIATLIKLRNLLPEDMVIDQKTYDNNTKAGDTADKKA